MANYDYIILSFKSAKRVFGMNGQLDVMIKNS